jgi:ribonuclease Z
MLVQGQAVTLADGRVVQPDEVLGEEIRGLKVVQVGDAGRTDNLVEACRGADALVIEATYTSAEADMAARFGHLTAAQAAHLPWPPACATCSWCTCRGAILNAT